MKLFFISIALFSLGFLSAQTSFLDEENHEKAKLFLYKDYDSTLFYTKKMKLSKNNCRVLWAKLLEANTLYKQDRYEECDQTLEALLNEIETQQDSANYSSSKLLIGKSYSECISILKLNIYRRFFYMRKNQKRLSEAYDYLLLVKSIVNELPKKDSYSLKNKISTVYAMASLKKVLGEYEESIKMLLEIDKEIEGARLDKDDQWYTDILKEQANINVQIGRNYINLAKENSLFYDSTEVYYDKVFRVNQKMDSSNSDFKAAHYFRKAELNSYTGNFEAALSLLDKYAQYKNNKTHSTGQYLVKSRIYLKINELDSAIFYAKKVLNNKENNGLKYITIELQNILAESYFLQNKTDSAYRYSTIALQTTKKFNANRENANKRLKEDELSQMLVLNKKIKEKRKSTENQLNALIVGAIIAFIGFVIYTVFRKKKEQKKIALIKIEYQKLNASIVRPKNAESKPEISDSRIEQILKELEVIENSDLFLNKNFNLSLLAKLLNTNTSYLSRIININKKTSFNQYLMDLRINALLKNLKENPITRKYSVQALGESVGYKNGSSFTRAFKSNMGMSPSQYLKDTYFDAR